MRGRGYSRHRECERLKGIDPIVPQFESHRWFITEKLVAACNRALVQPYQVFNGSNPFTGISLAHGQSEAHSSPYSKGRTMRSVAREQSSFSQ